MGRHGAGGGTLRRVPVHATPARDYREGERTDEPHLVHRVGSVRAPSAHAMARRGRRLAFSGLAVDVTTLVDRGLLLLRPGPLEAAGMREVGPVRARSRTRPVGPLLPRAAAPPPDARKAEFEKLKLIISALSMPVQNFRKVFHRQLLFVTTT